MTQAKPRFSSFNEYLEYENGTDSRFELVDGELVELPPESEPNVSIANYLFLLLVNAGIPFRLVHPHACELQVSIVQKGDPANRYPDLVILQEEHLQLTQRRLTIKLDMSPPKLVVEVVSPGESNRERDYKRKVAQYQKRQIPEYWLIDPEAQTITVLRLESEKYVQIGTFRGNERINSSSLEGVNLTADQILSAVR